MRRVAFLIWKELIELKDDKRLFGIVIAAPILQLFMLGYAATTDVRNVPVVIADADRSAASRDLIASVADTQQVAFQAALLVSFLPTLMLSGFIFPITSMPPFLQAITYAVPARYFLIALRGILLKGVSIQLIWVELAALSIYALLVLTLASIRLRRQWS